MRNTAIWRGKAKVRGSFPRESRSRLDAWHAILDPTSECPGAYQFVELTSFQYSPFVTLMFRAWRIVVEYCESEWGGGSLAVCVVGAGQVVRRLLAGEVCWWCRSVPDSRVGPR